jgi:RHS repeat-associated protein
MLPTEGWGCAVEILAETDASGNTLNEYVFFGGKRVALVPSSGSALYYAEDLLGSSRVIAQSNGTLCYDADFTPYGGERSYTSTCAQDYKFEGKERDTETQNDDFGAREYSWRFGRWLSADWSSVPAPVPYANLSNPQTLNLYAMVADDPESFADLDGHDRNQSGCTVGDADSCTVNKTLHGMGLPPTTTDQADAVFHAAEATSAAMVAEMQAAAQKTSVSVKSLQYTNVATDNNGKPARGMNGATLGLEAFVSGDYAAYNWKQTVTESVTGADGQPPNKPYNDAAPDTKLYWSADQQTSATSRAAKDGAQAFFWDNPKDYGGVSFKWHADLSLIGIDKSGKQTTLWETSWGFTVNGATGKTTLENGGKLPGVTQ